PLGVRGVRAGRRFRWDTQAQYGVWPPVRLARRGRLLRSRARIGGCTPAAPTVRPRTFFFHWWVSAPAGKGPPVVCGKGVNTQRSGCHFRILRVDDTQQAQICIQQGRARSPLLKSRGRKRRHVRLNKYSSCGRIERMKTTLTAKLKLLTTPDQFRVLRATRAR